MAREKIKVLIVEDSPVMRQLLTHVLSSDPQLEVIATAAGGEEALAFLARRKPDVVTCDINMPGMNGFEVTRQIMESDPLPVVIVSASWNPAEVATTFNAMEAGAVAVVGKPHGPAHPDHGDEARKLVQTVKAMSEVRVVRRWSRKGRPEPAAARPVTAPRPAAGVELIAIGASTSGPIVLQTILARLPATLPVPVLIVQHIAAGFLDGLADWLTKTTAIPTHVATPGQRPLAGHAYLAPDGYHMGVSTDGSILLDAGPPDDGLRPSATHLFTSVARVLGARAVGVLLTGMGRDGADALKLMRERGALTIAQDRETSVVYGMPGEAERIGAAAHMLSPEKIAAMLEASVR